MKNQETCLASTGRGKRTAWQLEVLGRANKNLRALFPEKMQPITFEDIEKAYLRNALSIEADSKTTKGSANGYLTGIWYGASGKLAGINTCAFASDGCLKACLISAGRGAFYNVTRARIVKTLALFFDMPRYEKTLHKSIESLKRKAAKRGMRPVVRLNGTTDLAWEKITNLMQYHSDVQFYDYTKNPRRAIGEMPANYDLTFSLSESNKKDAIKVLQNGGRVAVVFRKDIPKAFWGIKVVNGDNTDLRFLDAQNCIVGLKAKGKAKKDKSGFVQDVPTAPRMTQKIIVNYI